MSSKVDIGSVTLWSTDIGQLYSLKQVKFGHHICFSHAHILSRSISLGVGCGCVMSALLELAREMMIHFNMGSWKMVTRAKCFTGCHVLCGLRLGDVNTAWPIWERLTNQHTFVSAAITPARYSCLPFPNCKIYAQRMCIWRYCMHRFSFLFG